METNAPISDRELREAYSLLSKEDLITVLIGKHKEIRLLSLPAKEMQSKEPDNLLYGPAPAIKLMKDRLDKPESIKSADIGREWIMDIIEPYTINGIVSTTFKDMVELIRTEILPKYQLKDVREVSNEEIEKEFPTEARLVIDMMGFSDPLTRDQSEQVADKIQFNYRRQEGARFYRSQMKGK